MLMSFFSTVKEQVAQGALSGWWAQERRFATPEWEYVCLAVVFLCVISFLFVRRRRAAVAARFDGITLARAFPEWRPFAFLLRAILYTVALALVCLSLARPQWGYELREVKSRGSLIMVAVDVSQSMLASDLSPTRLAIARRALSDLSRQVSGDRLGLVPFAGVPFLLCPPTEDMDAFRVFLDMLEPALIPVQGTDLAGALDTALAAFDQGDAADTQAILLLSDGEDHSEALTASIDRAVKAGVRVFTVGLGTAAGAPIPVEGGGFKTDDAGEMILSKRSDATLKDIADKTGGVYVKADAGLDLAALYVSTVRPHLRESDFKSDQSRVWNEVFTVPLFVAVILFICVAWRLPFRRTPLGVFWLTCAFVGMSVLSSAPLAVAGDQPLLRYNAGNQACDAKAYDRAISAYHDVLNNASSDADLKTRAWFNLGNALYHSGKKQEAVESFDKLLSKNPDHRAARFNRDLIQKELDQEKNEQEKNKENQDPQNQDQQDAGNQGEQQGSSGETKDGAAEGASSDSQGQQEGKTGESAGETNPDQGAESGEKSGKSDVQTDDPASDSESDTDHNAGDDAQSGQEKSGAAGAQDAKQAGGSQNSQQNSPTDQGTQQNGQADPKDTQQGAAQDAQESKPGNAAQNGDTQTGVPEAGNAETGDAQAASNASPDPRARAAERWLQVVPDSGKSIFQGQVRRSLPNRAMPKEDW